jgi:hypothetical protein
VDPGNLKATPRRRRHRPHPRRHDRHRDLGDDGIGIELRHLAIALPASAVTGVVGYLTRQRPGPGRSEDLTGNGVGLSTWHGATITGRPRDACGISFFVHEAGGIQARAEASTTLVAPDSAGHVQLASDGETRAPGGLTGGGPGSSPSTWCRARVARLTCTPGFPSRSTCCPAADAIRWSVVGTERAGLVRARPGTRRTRHSPRHERSRQLPCGPRPGTPRQEFFNELADIATSGRQPSDDELIGIHQRHDHYRSTA